MVTGQNVQRPTLVQPQRDRHLSPTVCEGHFNKYLRFLLMTNNEGEGGIIAFIAVLNP